MSTLWVFGDSFAAAKKQLWQDMPMEQIKKTTKDYRLWDRENPRDYKEHLAVKLEVDYLQDSQWTAANGTSDEFMTMVATRLQPFIQPEDYSTM